METKTMIRELRNVAEKYKGKPLLTFETDIHAMCLDVIKKLEEYESKETPVLCGGFYNNDYERTTTDTCGKCGEVIGIDFNYCPECGYAIRWELTEEEIMEARRIEEIRGLEYEL